MSLGSGVGEQTAKTLVDGVQQLLGRPLEDAEKVAAAQLQAVIDHALAGLDAILGKYASQLAGKKIVISPITISIEDKDKT